MTQARELTQAREILASLKAAYIEHTQWRGLTKRYKIKEREIEFVDLADLLRQIRYWERQIQHLETATGQRPTRAHRIISRF